MIHETPMHAKKTTLSWALLSGGVIGSHFFQNDDGTEQSTVRNIGTCKPIIFGYLCGRT